MPHWAVVVADFPLIGLSKFQGPPLFQPDESKKRMIHLEVVRLFFFV